MPGPPVRLGINHVPAYVLEKHGIKVSRQAVYRWINEGVNGETLVMGSVMETRGKFSHYVRFTTAQAVDDFIRQSGYGGTYRTRPK
jgi:hypothetical protein